MPLRSVRKRDSSHDDSYLLYFADRILDLGNLGFSFLVLGQAFNEKLNGILLIGGIIFLFAAYFVAYLLIKKGGGMKK